MEAVWNPLTTQEMQQYIPHRVCFLGTSRTGTITLVSFYSPGKTKDRVKEIQKYTRERERESQRGRQTDRDTERQYETKRTK